MEKPLVMMELKYRIERYTPYYTRWRKRRHIERKRMSRRVAEQPTKPHKTPKSRKSRRAPASPKVRAKAADDYMEWLLPRSGTVSGEIDLEF
jgi:hypothetical protein